MSNRFRLTGSWFQTFALVVGRSKLEIGERIIRQSKSCGYKKTGGLPSRLMFVTVAQLLSLTLDIGTRTRLDHP